MLNQILSYMCFNGPLHIPDVSETTLINNSSTLLVYYYNPLPKSQHFYTYSLISNVLEEVIVNHKNILFHLFKC